MLVLLSVFETDYFFSKRSGSPRGASKFNIVTFAGFFHRARRPRPKPLV
jgi:hypothetical protein